MYRPVRKWLYLPVETASRELDGKLLLAVAGVRAGMNVVVAEHRSLFLRLPDLPAGVVIEKSAAAGNLPYVKVAKENGHLVCALGEEGLVTHDPERYLKLRICKDVLEALRAFFAWGPVQKEIIDTKYPGSSEIVCAVGNPRLDLLHPRLRNFYAQEVEAIRDVYGDFVLLNTNFGAANSPFGEKRLLELMETAGGDDGESGNFLRGWVDFHARARARFLEMVRYLSAECPFKLVVRPHPSEDAGTWRSELRDYERADVVREGNVVAWLLASKALVHSGCTTAVEASLLGMNPIEFVPFGDSRYEPQLPRMLSRQGSTLTEIQALVEAEFAGKSTGNQCGNTLKQYVIWDSDELAVERMIRTIEPLMAVAQAGSLGSALSVSGLSLSRATEIAEYLPSRRAMRRYRRQKFPVIARRKIGRKVDKCCKALGSISDVGVSRLWRDGFLVELL